jgi:hypothetical protein
MTQLIYCQVCRCWGSGNHEGHVVTQISYCQVCRCWFYGNHVCGQVYSNHVCDTVVA